MAQSAGNGAIDGADDLTLAQKVSLTAGAGTWHTPAIPAAGIDSVVFSDGPHGVRRHPDAAADALDLDVSVPATCFPPAAGLGSSWHPELVERVGRAIGLEAAAQGVSVLLGPGVNIKRSPLGGRNFEYASEDPLLSGRLGAAFVRGVQSTGVGACVKHYAVNNQETDRMRVSAEVDERTLREIYLPAFEHIVTTARPAAVMCSYNRVNGRYASQCRWLLTDLLRGEWGFDGVVVSDWGAVTDRVRSLSAGLDLEMPPPAGGNAEVLAAVTAGRLKESTVDAAARRVRTLVDRTAAARVDAAAVDAAAHHALARSAAQESAVLLKNAGGLLPLDPAGRSTLAVVGEFARTPRIQGGGSSHVVPTRVDNALDAIRAAVAAPDRVEFAPGFTLDGRPDPVLVADAVALAARAHTVLVFVGLPSSAESEGFDRTDLSLPADQVALLHALADLSERVVVVLSHGSPVELASWRDRVPAILTGWLLGQAGGGAVADLLFGAAEPSGRLAESLPLRLRDTPSYLHFPGGEGRVRYGEGIYVGYRYYDTVDTPVAYPFGHGLTYTTFAYSALRVARTGANAYAVTFTVTNTGRRAGAETAQVYVRDLESSVDRPSHELRAFAKVRLDPGASATVTLDLDPRAFAYFSPRTRRWRVEPGDVEIQVGASSRDIRLRRTVRVAGDGDDPVLTVESTLGEWLASPYGGGMRAALTAAGHAGALRLPDDVPPIAAATPLSRLVSFLPGVTSDDIAHYARAAADSDGVAHGRSSRAATPTG
jgi:beta-glucosidase